MKLSMYSAVFAAVLLCPSGYAQTNDSRADVPFHFRVGDTDMPAGNYIIQDAPGLLALREIHGKAGIFQMTMSGAARPQATTVPTLTFNRYADEYYLTSVWPANSREGRAVLRSKREREVANRLRTVQTADIALQRASR